MEGICTWLAILERNSLTQPEHGALTSSDVRSIPLFPASAEIAWLCLGPHMNFAPVANTWTTHSRVRISTDLTALAGWELKSIEREQAANFADKCESYFVNKPEFTKEEAGQLKNEIQTKEDRLGVFMYKSSERLGLPQTSRTETINGLIVSGGMATLAGRVLREVGDEEGEEFSDKCQALMMYNYFIKKTKFTEEVDGSMKYPFRGGRGRAGITNGFIDVKDAFKIILPGSQEGCFRDTIVGCWVADLMEVAFGDVVQCRFGYGNRNNSKYTLRRQFYSENRDGHPEYFGLQNVPIRKMHPDAGRPRPRTW
ncbi:hypothetical protein DL95DRAFT_466648 [Leptodontidium sp. 2 PMI_412]|nr:hypothetical protein DL95DRAFT_466648 [Leptodontidium sp. 2 PMI_412]